MPGTISAFGLEITSEKRMAHRFEFLTWGYLGFGLSGEHEKEWMMRREALKVSQAMFPEYVGLRCIDGVVKLFDGQDVPERDVTPTVSMTVDNLEKYYPKVDGVWTPDLAAIAAIPVKASCTNV